MYFWLTAGIKNRAENNKLNVARSYPLTDVHVIGYLFNEDILTIAEALAIISSPVDPQPGIFPVLRFLLDGAFK